MKIHLPNSMFILSAISAVTDTQKGHHEVTLDNRERHQIPNKDGELLLAYLRNPSESNAGIKIDKIDGEGASDGGVNSQMLSALRAVIDLIEEPPDKACSCHINPPCTDCVNHSAAREAFEMVREAIASAEGKEAS